MEILGITFLEPLYFLLFLVLVFVLYFYYKIQKNWFLFWAFNDLKKVYKINNFYYYLKFILIIIIFSSFIILLSDPNKINTSEKISKKWIDIVLALDVSESMLAEDLKPNRLESAKNVISDFIKKQKTNRLWLVVFSWKPFTSIPLTFDYNILTQIVKDLETKSINQNILWWTAIWDAIFMSKTLFSKKEEEKDRQKVIILLTDWEANTWADPKIASLSAKEENIKIYTIWIWSKNWWYISYNNWFFEKKIAIQPLNDKSLKEISKISSGEYFRATDDDSLKNIFNILEKFEKKDIETEIKKDFTPFYKIFMQILIISMFLFMFIILKRD